VGVNTITTRDQGSSAQGISFSEVWYLVSPFSDTIVSMYRDPQGIGQLTKRHACLARINAIGAPGDFQCHPGISNLLAPAWCATARTPEPITPQIDSRFHTLPTKAHCKSNLIRKSHLRYHNGLLLAILFISTVRRRVLGRGDIDNKLVRRGKQRATQPRITPLLTRISRTTMPPSIQRRSSTRSRI
jgi:hypothetical protein